MRRMVTRRAIGAVGCLFGAAMLTLGLVGPPDANAVRCGLPATGQTTCWDSAGNVIPCAGTGQDGDIQAGKMLRYKDNGDGTITDLVTRLTWEKKSMDGSIHDKNNAYSWDDAFAVHVAGLNAANFAGHDDWRLPNVKELQSIIDYENVGPAVDPAFNTGCIPGSTVLTDSCTGLGFFTSSYWSSSTRAINLANAWLVEFAEGGTNIAAKSTSGIFNKYVRAVRGGCVN